MTTKDDPFDGDDDPGGAGETGGSGDNTAAIPLTLAALGAGATWLAYRSADGDDPGNE